MLNLLYLILAAFGLGFLVFIHELGHYFMARRVGMKVEAFGIGFGKPIKTWKHKGVQWNICWLPFGGYVRIAGMEKEKGKEPHQIKDGFFGKPPIDRIKVGIMGPVVNIVFAFLLFLVLWFSGGREKTFSEFTKLIGWVDPESELYHLDVRPGDAIKTYGGRSFEGFQDLQYQSILSANKIAISGERIDYHTLQETPFQYILETYPSPMALDASIRTIGVLNPASYLLCNSITEGEDSPLFNSGIEKNDRIVWADGELIFSMPQLSNIVNQSKALITVKRGEKIIQTRLPRIRISDMRALDKGEMGDWLFETDLKDRLENLYFIPFALSYDATIEKSLAYFNAQSNEINYTPTGDFEIPLHRGDRILAVDGIPVQNTPELLALLQERHVQIIVQREEPAPLVSWQEADQVFIHSIHYNELQTLISGIGTINPHKTVGTYHLLNPVTPKPFTTLSHYLNQKSTYEKDYEMRKKLVEEIENPKQRAKAQHVLEESQDRLVLGFSPRDQLVKYNPSPIRLFTDVFGQMVRTLKSLVTGSLSPKWMAGPIGIIQVFHYGWSHGIKEALYWMAAISLNLGLFNLLPIPVLDGGHILFSLIEMVTGKPLKSKTMERWIVPFVVLIIGAFIYFTYNDLMRLFSQYWK